MPDPVNAILLQFPGPVMLRASPLKWALVMMVCICALAFGFYGLKFPQEPRFQTMYFKMVLWSCLGFGAIGVLVAITAMLPNASKLLLNRNGFEVTSLFRTHNVLWRDATGFQVRSVASNKLVVYDDAKYKGSNAALLNTSLSGRNSGLPDTYGLSAYDLARLMNEWRERALK